MLNKLSPETFLFLKQLQQDVDIPLHWLRRSF